MTGFLQQHIRQQLSQALHADIQITEWSQVFGGDINTTFIIQTQRHSFFVKYNRALTNMFEKEYRGLQLLRGTNTLKVPQPVITGAIETGSYLVMECLERVNASATTWQKLGVGLAALHRQTQPQFGLEESNFIGSLVQSNDWCNSWAEFYATQRILPLMQQALQQNQCTVNDVKQAEQLCKQVETLFPDEPPALLHGDLWSGNVMACATGEVAVYDPAVYYGNREMDIAMTMLFGGFDTQFYHHYNEAYALQNGWCNRIEICQLYPLLVHLLLFGGSYYHRVKSILNAYR